MNSNQIYDKSLIRESNTVYEIAKKYNINPELLSLVNGLNIDDYVYENQEILIPKSNYSYYLTKSGDSLDDVLKLFNANYKDFKSINVDILLDEGQLFAYKR